MTTALFLQIVTIASDLIIFLLVGLYLWSLQKDKKSLEEREEKLAKKEAGIEEEYRQIIDNAHSQEEKILNDAAQKASNIIANAQNISDSTKQTLNEALEHMIVNVQNEAVASSNNYLNNYKNFLDQISQNSINNFQSAANEIESELQSQMQEFRSTQINNLQKELDEYKQQRFEVAEKRINEIIQKVAEEVFNKSVTLEGHKELIIESLEKSRKKGVFE